MKDCIDKKIAILEEKLIASREATVLQAKEYERRLEALNGEAHRLKEMQEKYLPRETYAVEHQRLTDKMEAVQKLLYIGLGGGLMIELFLKYLIK